MKHMSRSVGLSAAVVALLASGAVPVAAAEVSSVKAAVEMGFQFQSADVDQNSPAVALYTVKGLPKGGQILLQRSFGTGKVFKTIATTTTPSGALTTTAPSMGEYTYRLLVKSRSGKRIARHDQKLRAYGDVALADMNNGSTATVQVGDTLFRYARDFSVGWDPSTCRRFLVRAAQPPNSWGRTTAGKVQIVQEKGDMVEIAVAPGQIVEQSVDFFGGAVNINLSKGYYTVYLDGVGNCYTSSGELE